MNKQGRILIRGIILILALLISTIFITYTSYITKNNDCLKEIANNYCLSQDYIFNNVYWDIRPMFSCSENERTLKFIKFKFTKQELEDCK